MQRKVNVVEDLDGNKIVVIHDIIFKGKRTMEWTDVEEYLKRFVGEEHIIEDTGDLVYDDPATAVEAHIRQYGFIHIDHAKKVHIKLVLGLRKLGEFHSSGYAKPCAVDDNIDLTLFLCNLIDCSSHRYFISYICIKMFYTF